MLRRSILCVVLLFAACLTCFGQTAALRDYVGMISQGFHPDIVTFLQKLKSDLDKKGYNAAARNLENFMKGYSGTGFVYVGGDGINYMLTNYHVISQAYTLSVTFEKQDGEKTVFSDLSIIAADEDMDIALLAFAGGQNPFKQGLAFMSRSVQEGDDVYSAGFPGLGSNMIWQLGRGMISNVSVRFPESDNSDKMLGPYIQHTAQVDPGNSGGPLLIQAQGVPSGYAVAGINTRSARSRQAANYSIPINQVQSFLDASLKPPLGDQKPVLEARINAFIEGLKAPKAVYPHIAAYLSNICTGENAEYAVSELQEKAPKTVRDNVFDQDIILCLNYAVAWTIESSIRSKTGGISITLDSINPDEENKTYNVNFKVNNGIVNSIWINEYGIWRIRSFGASASGDKTLVQKKAREKADAGRLHDDPILMLSAGLAYLFDPLAAFGADLVLKTGKTTGVGVNFNFANDYAQIDVKFGLYYPIKMGTTALTPLLEGGIGMMFYPAEGSREGPGNDFSFGAKLRAGLSFTTAAVPGLYLQAAYQRNIFKKDLFGDEWLHPDMIYIGVGYAIGR
ncbi:MAG: serine protease [Treponema sp.]|jgi:serine protease Do|nr:serine protease [Treponema sp.]